MNSIDPTVGKCTSKATRRDWIGLAILSLPCIVYAMDLTLLNLAMPSISADLRPSAAQLLWIVDAYGFLAAGSLLTMGTLGDRIGRRRLLLIGSAIFGLLSLVAAFARNAEMLIVVRALLGIASATMAPSTLSLISNMFHDDRERTMAVSVWVASFSFGGAIGPAIGGLILAHFWWGAVFLAPIPVMVLLLVLGPATLPEYKNPKAGRLDFVSAAMSLAAVLPIIFGIKKYAEGGGVLLATSAVIVGVVFGTFFVKRQSRLEDPLLDLNLLKRPAVTAALAINIFDFFVGFGILILVAQYLQLVLGLTAFQAGLWSIPAGLGFVSGSLLTSMMLTRMRSAYVLAVGLTIGSLGLLLMAVGVNSYSLACIISGNVLFAIGTAPGVAIVASLVVSSAPSERSGAASALSETASEFGGALGIALLGSLATFIYRTKLNNSMPSGVPTDAALTALRGIGAATDVSRNLVGGGALQTAAQAAYTFAASFSFFIASGIVLITAVVAVMVFRTEATSRR